MLICYLFHRFRLIECNLYKEILKDLLTIYSDFSSLFIPKDFIKSIQCLFINDLWSFSNFSTAINETKDNITCKTPKNP